ncbi:MAG: hypothetical protein FWF56_05950 [Firmicutes bacterium]|nr:hypothetical protein [Bacillota bacterium]MCL1953548.1 hypothetical protein [Bacillota bacterium]
MKLNKAVDSIKCEIGGCNRLSKWYLSFDGYSSERNINACDNCLKEISELVVNKCLSSVEDNNAIKI